jgi:hypothetical protein
LCAVEFFGIWTGARIGRHLGWLFTMTYAEGPQNLRGIYHFWCNFINVNNRRSGSKSNRLSDFRRYKVGPSATYSSIKHKHTTHSKIWEFMRIKLNWRQEKSELFSVWRLTGSVPLKNFYLGWCSEEDCVEAVNLSLSWSSAASKNIISNPLSCNRSPPRSFTRWKGDFVTVIWKSLQFSSCQTHPDRFWGTQEGHSWDFTRLEFSSCRQSLETNSRENTPKLNHSVLASPVLTSISSLGKYLLLQINWYSDLTLSVS